MQKIHNDQDSSKTFSHQNPKEKQKHTMLRLKIRINHQELLKIILFLHHHLSGQGSKKQKCSNCPKLMAYCNHQSFTWNANMRKMGLRTV